MKIKILIILTITLMLLGGYYYGLVVFAKEQTETPDKTLVTTIGTDITEILKYDNYVVVSNTVNTSQAGIYSVVYRHIETNEEVTKMVHVLDDEQSEYFLTEKTEEICLTTGTYDIAEVITVNDQVKTIYNLKRDGTVFNNWFCGFLTETGFGSDTVSLYSKATICDTYEGEDSLAIVGTDVNVMNGDRDIVIFNNNKGHFEAQMIENAGSETATSIAFNKDYYFVAGTTTETNEMFIGERKGQDAFLILVNRETKLVDNVTMFPLTGDDQIQEIIFLNNYLYVLQTNNSNQIRLLKIDIFGNIIAEQNLNFNYGFKNQNLRLINNKVYLSYAYYDYEYLDYLDVISEVSESLNVLPVYLKHNANNYLFDYTFNQEGYLITLLTNEKTKLGYTYQIFSKDGNLIGNYSSTEQVYPKGLGKNNIVVCQKKDSKTIDYYEINSLIKINSASKIIDPRLSDNENYQNITNYKYLINGSTAKHSDKSDINYDINLFGSYTSRYYFEDKFDYYEEVIIEVIPFCGISDNQEYDLGIEILGNGKIYIDNYLVDSPYKIENEGKYEIKLVGKDDKVKLYNISVNKKSIEFIEKPAMSSYGLSQYQTVDDINYGIDVSFSEKNSTTSSKKSSSIFYLVPVITLGIAFIIFKRSV